MKWQMNENSLFAILLRSSWWVSFAIAAALTAVAVALLSEPYRLFGAVTGLPFFVIGCIAAWRQFQAPSTARIDKTVAAVRAMSWVEFSRAIEAAYRRDGYDITAVNAAAADFRIRKEWRIALSAASAGRRRARASSRCRTTTRQRRRMTRRSAST
jgi:restriction system protein